MIYFLTAHYSSRTQPLENHTFSGRLCIYIGLLNPLLSVVTVTMCRNVCWVSCHCSAIYIKLTLCITQNEKRVGLNKTQMGTTVIHSTDQTCSQRFVEKIFLNKV